MIDRNRILIISNHYRKLSWWDTTIEMIYNHGYKNIWINETCREKINGVSDKVRSFSNVNKLHGEWYDGGMVEFKKIIKGIDYDVILLLDTDIFISGTSHLDKYINEFVDKKLDFASHTIDYIANNIQDPNKYQSMKYKKEDCIIEINNHTLVPAEVWPYYIPYPHFENCYLLTTKDLWDRMTEDDLSHGRKWGAALNRENAKIGIHKANYRGGYSSWGDEWFHLGGIMGVYNSIEMDAPQDIDKELILARIGYCIEEYEIYGEQCQPPIYISNLKKIINSSTYSIAKDKWAILKHGTCMERIK